MGQDERGGALKTAEELARAALLMEMAHVQHVANKADKKIKSCKGSADTLTGHFCQFKGTAREQQAHRLERVAAAIEAELRPERAEPCGEGAAHRPHGGCPGVRAHRFTMIGGGEKE